MHYALHGTDVVSVNIDEERWNEAIEVVEEERQETGWIEDIPTEVDVSHCHRVGIPLPDSRRLMYDTRVAPDMIKVVYLLVRKEGWSYEEFLEYWQGTHVPLAKQQPNLERYTTSVFLEEENRPYDGMAQLYFESEAALEEAMDSDIKAEIQDDAGHFLDLEKTLRMVLREEVQ